MGDYTVFSGSADDTPVYPATTQWDSRRVTGWPVSTSTTYPKFPPQSRADCFGHRFRHSLPQLNLVAFHVPADHLVAGIVCETLDCVLLNRRNSTWNPSAETPEEDSPVRSNTTHQNPFARMGRIRGGEDWVSSTTTRTRKDGLTNIKTGGASSLKHNYANSSRETENW